MYAGKFLILEVLKENVKNQAGFSLGKAGMKKGEGEQTQSPKLPHATEQAEVFFISERCASIYF